MIFAEAGKWNSPFAFDIARRISFIPSLYCGPASVAWIASAWNESKGRKYDFSTRLSDKTLFPDGPRAFHGKLPGFQLSLDDLLRRETNGELKLSPETYFSSRSIHNALGEYEMPVILRVRGKKLKDGLHYLALYKSALLSNDESDALEFCWQDNGLLGVHDGITTGLGSTIRKASHKFIWGAKRVVES